MMPENEPRRELDVETLRAFADQREAEELREELVRYFREGVGTGELLSTLRPVVRQALDTILKEALTDERFQERLGRHVADRVLAGVAKELQVAQVEILHQVRQEMAAAWRRDATAVLRQGFEEALKKQEMVVRTPPAVSPATEVKEALPPVELAPRRWPRFRIRWARPVWERFQLHLLIGGAVVLLLLSSVLIFELTRRSPSRVPSKQMELPGPPALREEAVDRESLLRIWTELMVGAEKHSSGYAPMLESLDQRSSSHFSCWFPDSTISELEEIRSIARDLSGDTLQERLVRAFDPCVSQEYGEEDERLVVFGAQVAVHNLQGRKEGSPQELPRLLADGHTGEVTIHFLNTFLENEGIYPHFQITRDSSIEEYLFTLYLALKELESSE